MGRSSLGRENSVCKGPEVYGLIVHSHFHRFLNTESQCGVGMVLGEHGPIRRATERWNPSVYFCLCSGMIGKGIGMGRF